MIIARKKGEFEISLKKVRQKGEELRAIPETRTKRQAIQHGFLPSLLGDRDKGIEIVYGDGGIFLYWVD